MELSAKAADVEDILPWRDMYRLEMPCQIIHDSLHSRQGWTKPYLLVANGVSVGYGSIAVGGPWKGKPTVFEWYVVPQHRSRIFDLFGALLAGSGAIAIETKSNAPLLTAMMHTFAQNVMSESILFHDKLTTTHSPPGATVRRATPEDAPQLLSHELDSEADWVVEVESKVAAAGVNRPIATPSRSCAARDLSRHRKPPGRCSD